MRARAVALAAPILAFVLVAVAPEPANAHDPPLRVLKTTGFTDHLPRSPRCPAYVARFSLGRQIGAETVVAGTAVVTIPRIAPVGQASFCVRRAQRGGSSTSSKRASGVLTLSLPGGKIEATLSEIQGPRRAARRAYSAIGTIRGGTGRYRDVQGHIRGLGFVTFDRQGRECRKVALRVELEPPE